MEQLLLINPAPRKKGAKKMAKHRRSAAQKAATRRMLAARRAKYSHNPSPRKAKRKYRKNPIGHRIRHVYHKARHHVRKYRRNPSPRGIGGMFMPALWGAGGALAVDLVTGYIPLPLAIKVSPARHLVKAVLAVGMGMVFRSGAGRQAAEGALTVAFHDAAREAVQMVAPTIQLGAEPSVSDLAGMGYYNPATVPNPQALGYYQEPGMAGMGEYSENGYQYTA